MTAPDGQVPPAIESRSTAHKSAFGFGLYIDIFVDETLPSECASKGDYILVDFAVTFALLTCKPQQLGARISQ